MCRGPEFRLVARNSGRSESEEARYARNQHSTWQDPRPEYTSCGGRRVSCGSPRAPEVDRSVLKNAAAFTNRYGCYVRFISSATRIESDLRSRCATANGRLRPTYHPPEPLDSGFDSAMRAWRRAARSAAGTSSKENESARNRRRQALGCLGVQTGCAGCRHFRPHTPNVAVRGFSSTAWYMKAYVSPV